MLEHINPTPDLADQVYEALLEGICSGSLPPGEKFTQEALAARLGVSRQPVLHALLLLRRQGLMVDTENRRGVRVAVLDAGFVASLYEVRAALDGLAARSAATQAGAALQNAGSEIVRRGRRAAERGDLKALVGLDLEFHRFLYEASGNGLLLDTAQLHWHHTRRVMTDYLSRGRAPSFRTVWDEHDAILQAIVAGQADAAERLSREHAARSVKLLQAGQRAQPAGAARSTAAVLGADAVSSASTRRY